MGHLILDALPSGPVICVPLVVVVPVAIFGVLERRADRWDSIYNSLGAFRRCERVLWPSWETPWSGQRDDALREISPVFYRDPLHCTNWYVFKIFIDISQPVINPFDVWLPVCRPWLMWPGKFWVNFNMALMTRFLVLIWNRLLFAIWGYFNLNHAWCIYVVYKQVIRAQVQRTQFYTLRIKRYIGIPGLAFTCICVWVWHPWSRNHCEQLTSYHNQ